MSDLVGNPEDRFSHNEAQISEEKNYAERIKTEITKLCRRDKSCDTLQKGRILMHRNLYFGFQAKLDSSRATVASFVLKFKLKQMLVMYCFIGREKKSKVGVVSMLICILTKSLLYVREL